MSALSTPVVSPPATEHVREAKWATFSHLSQWLSASESHSAKWLRSVGLLVVAYLAIRTPLFKFTKLPEELYGHPSILLASFQHLPMLIVWGFVGWFVWQTWANCRWATVDPSQRVKMLLGCVTGILAWTFSTYDYNLYFDQGHLFERIGLVLLGMGVWWRPTFLAPFLMLVYLITHQFDAPVSCTWTDKRALFDVLALGVAYLTVRLWRNLSPNVLLMAILALVGANYFIPGWAKMIAGWPFVERLDNLFVSSYLNGWWGQVSEGTILSIANTVARWNWFFVWSSLILELAAVLMLWNRPACVALLLGCVGLHGMIFLSTGILFWKWILLDLILSVVVLIRDPDQEFPLFSRNVRWWGVGLVAFSPLYFSPIWLGWYDTELTDLYHLQVVGDSGKTYNMPRNWLTPYEVFFAQDKFHFLIPDKVVVGRYGTTPSWEVMRRLDGRPTPEQAQQVCEELGESEYSEKKIAAFDRFFTRYFETWNKGRRPHFVPTWLQTPHHIHAVVPGPVWEGQENVTQVRVVHVRGLYQRDRVVELARQVVHEIDIPR